MADYTRTHLLLLLLSLSPLSLLLLLPLPILPHLPLLAPPHTLSNRLPWPCLLMLVLHVRLPIDSAVAVRWQLFNVASVPELDIAPRRPFATQARRTNCLMIDDRL